MTALGVLSVHPDAQVVGIDESADMLAYARQALPAGSDLRVARIEDPLLEGPFDLVVSALTVHHLDGEGKADLYRRLAGVLVPGGRVVVADVVVPEDPADAVTPIDGEYDTPSSVADQLGWLTDAGFRASVAWSHADLAVLVGDLIAPS
jgi:SAM-dependent methyltransferase